MSFLTDTNDFVERITSILNSKGMNIDIYYFLSNHIPKEYYDKQRNHPILNEIKEIKKNIEIQENLLNTLKERSKIEFTYTLLKEVDNENNKYIEFKNKLELLMDSNKELLKYDTIETYDLFKIQYRNGVFKIDRFILSILEDTLNICFIILNNSYKMIHETTKKQIYKKPSYYIFLLDDSYYCLSLDNVFIFEFDELPEIIIETIIDYSNEYDNSIWNYNKDLQLAIDMI